MKYKVNGQIVVANSIGDAIKLSDSDKLHQMAYKFAQMGNYFDRANSARSRYVLAKEDETKLNEFYKYALQVYDQLKKEVDALQRINGDNENWAAAHENETADLLADGIHNLYWAGNTFSRQGDRIRSLAKKLDELLKVYQDYAGKRRLKRKDSVNDTSIKDYKSCPNYPSTSSYSPNVILDQFNSIEQLIEYVNAHPEQADKLKKTKADIVKRLKDYIDHYSKECSNFEKFSNEYSEYMRYVRQLFYDYQRSGRFADSIKDRDLTKAEESEIARELTRQFNIKFTTTGESCVEPTRGISSHSDLDKKIVSYLKSKGYKVEWDSIGDDGCYYLMK